MNGIFLIRPFTFQFLKEMAKYCEIIVFTAATQEYADAILDCLEITDKYFDYRLYRQHTSFHGISLVKDLSWIGRDLKKTLIIDNIADNFKLQYANGLHIKTWCGDIRDEEFSALIPLLINLFKSNPSNIIPSIKMIKENYKNNGSSYVGLKP